MKRQLRKIIRENINALFEFTAADKQKELQDIQGDINRGEELMDFTKREAEVAKKTKQNIDKTKSNIPALNPAISAMKKTLAAKESKDQGEIEREKRDVYKDLAKEKDEDETKLNAVTNMPTDSNDSEESDEMNVSTPDAPTTPVTPDTPVTI